MYPLNLLKCIKCYIFIEVTQWCILKYSYLKQQQLKNRSKITKILWNVKIFKIEVWGGTLLT